MIVSLVLGAILGDGLIVFMSINMSLASIAYGLAILAAHLIEKKVKAYLIGIILFLWILFFPNTVYMTTDLIHFQHYPFVSGTHVYQFDIELWLVFTHLVIGALLAAKLGILSVEKVFGSVMWQKKYQYAVLTGLFTLSSIGIAIGRFFRYNSWEIYQVNSIMRDLLNHFSFIMIFVMLFIGIHWVLYSLFKERGK